MKLSLHSLTETTLWAIIFQDIVTTETGKGKGTDSVQSVKRLQTKFQAKMDPLQKCQSDDSLTWKFWFESFLALQFLNAQRLKEKIIIGRLTSTTNGTCQQL